MRKIFGFIFVFLLAFPMAACGQNKMEEKGTAPDYIVSEPIAEEEIIVKAEFCINSKSLW